MLSNFSSALINLIKLISSIPKIAMHSQVGNKANQLSTNHNFSNLGLKNDKFCMELMALMLNLVSNFDISAVGKHDSDDLY